MLASMTLEPSEVQGALERLLASPEWENCPSSGPFLRFIVEQTLNGEGLELQEVNIGTQVFGRETGYNPRVDGVVRLEFMSLRDNLLRYYEGSGWQDPIQIDLTVGSYQPTFRFMGEPAAKPGWKIPWKVPAIAAGFLIMLTVAGYWISSLDASFFAVKPTGLFTDQKGNSRSPAFSPDGEWIAFARDLDGVYSNIYVQPTRGGSARLLTFGDAMDHEPAWSPDGERIAFVRQRASGGFSLMVKNFGSQNTSESAVALLSAKSGLDWTKDGAAILASDRSGPASSYSIFRIKLKGGQKEQLTNPSPDIAGDSDPKLSPDGKWLAFVRSENASAQDVYLMPISGGEPRRLSSAQKKVGGLCWTPDSSSLMASLEMGETPRALWRIPLEGGESKRISEIAGSPMSPTIPSKGKGLAYVERVSDTNLWVLDLEANGEPKKMTSSIQMDTGPQFSPDGKSLSWRSGQNGSNEIWVAAADGANPRVLTKTGGAVSGPAHWSSDSSELIFEARAEGKSSLFIVPVQGAEPRVLFSSESPMVLPSFSQDGKSVYYSTNQNSIWKLMRLDIKSRSSEVVLGDGAFAGIESPDGQWVFYTRQGQELAGIWRVPVKGGKEELLVGELSRKLWGQWAVSKKSLFYAVFPLAEKKLIRRMDLASGNLTDVSGLMRPPVPFDGGMSVSADESRLVWSQLDHSGSDIYVLGSFQ